MPLPVSVTTLNVPRVVPNVTVSPPVVRLLPLASLSRTLTVDVDVPSAAIEVGEAVINEVAADAAPVVKLTMTLSVIGVPFTVPVTVAVPVVVAEVSVAV